MGPRSWSFQRPVPARNGQYSGRMQRPASRPARLVAVVVAGLLAAGCNGSETGNGGEEDEQQAADVRAASINLQLTDLPEGYAAIPAPEDDAEARLADCPGFFEDGSIVADASSPGFASQTDTSLRFVTSRTAVLSGPGESEQVLASVREPAVLGCLSERFGEAFARIVPETTPAMALALAPDPSLPELGGASVGLVGTATFTSDAAPGPITLTTSIVFIQTGEVLSVLLFGGVLEPFPPEAIRALSTTVADRQTS